MKQILKTTDKKVAQSFEDQLYYTGAYDTGNTRARITHYTLKTPEGNKEIAQVSYNFSTGNYIIRM